MAKKARSTRSSPTGASKKETAAENLTSGAGEENDRVVLQVRLDPEVHRQLKENAEKGGISLNQLIQALCAGGVANLHHGKPRYSHDGILEGVEPRKKAFFVGRLGERYSPRDERKYMVSDDPRRFEPPEIGDHVNTPYDEGCLLFAMDLSGVGVVNFERAHK